MGLINNENAELIFSMHSMGGMSPEEIAGVLNISVDEVNAVINNTDYDGIDDEIFKNLENIVIVQIPALISFIFVFIKFS